MVQSDMSKSPPTPATAAQEMQMELLDNPPPLVTTVQVQLAGARRSGRCGGRGAARIFRAVAPAGEGCHLSPGKVLLPLSALSSCLVLPRRMPLLDSNPMSSYLLSYSKGARRKNRFKGSDGSTSSDTTSNSFVRQ
ncbi:Voltage-dependent L-type calcium channel subunit beta-2, partial [Varanus komodoensis]